MDKKQIKKELLDLDREKKEIEEKLEKLEKEQKEFKNLGYDQVIDEDYIRFYLDGYMIHIIYFEIRSIPFEKIKAPTDEFYKTIRVQLPPSRQFLINIACGCEGHV